jgi:hypothetical protein
MRGEDRLVWGSVEKLRIWKERLILVLLLKESLQNLEVSFAARPEHLKEG